MNKNIAAFIVLLSLVFSCAPSLAQITFSNVTDTAGPFDTSESWGASWGDLDGDGRPDLFDSNHRVRPAVWLNNADGTFTDVVLTVDTSKTWLDHVLADTHGGSWADYDNDGDQDLYSTTGSGALGRMQVNVNGRFQDKSVELGVSADLIARMVGWFDYDNDGLLDILIHARKEGWLYEQKDDHTFNPRSFRDQWDCYESHWGVPSDIDGDGEMEWLCVGDKIFPHTAYDIIADAISSKFVESTYSFPATYNTGDVGIADFDGDLRPDILVTRGRLRLVGGKFIPSLNKIEAWLRCEQDEQTSGFTFVSDGPITVDIDSKQFDFPNLVYIGATGSNPVPATIPFTLDPSDTTVHGFIPSDPLFDPNLAGNQGTYIGFDPVLKKWQVTMAPGDIISRGYYTVQATAPVSDFVNTGQTGSDIPVKPALLMNTGTGFVNESDTRGFGNNVFCPSLTTGDFDNDMDVDVYMVCRDYVANIANKLYENQGDGTFVEVASAGGAEGQIGVGLDSGAGVGEGVAVADFDVDGFLDFYLTNGLLMRPFGLGGPAEMFRNTSGDPGMGAENNHWILLDLVGAGQPSGSNRDGVGASVFATTSGGGLITQLREQNGGYRRWSQNHQRIHFGLGSNTLVDIEVRWPSGQIDTFLNVPADQLYSVNEGGTIDPVVLGPAIGFQPYQLGDECGTPSYVAEDDLGAFLWKDCAGDGSWFLRVTVGGSESIYYFEGSILSSLGFSSITGYSFDGGEILDTTDPNKAIYSLNVVKNGIDGLNFSMPAGSTTCFSLDMPGIQLYLGATHLPVNSAIDLDTFAACVPDGGASEGISVNDVSVNEADGVAEFSVSLSTASSQTITVDYATVDGSATDISGDYVATNGTLTFVPGEVLKTVSVTILDDAEAEVSETYTLTLSNETNTTISDGIGLGTITDNDISACGAPVYDQATEPGIFLWNDCSGGTGWHMRATGGGSTTGRVYDGTIISAQAFTSVTGVSIESSDTLDTTNPLMIDYLLKIWNGGVDGIDFSFPAGSNVCFDMVSAGLPVYVGSSRLVVAPPFDLDTLSGCTNLTVNDVTVSESDASATFTVDLSTASTQTVTVDYA
ncbi:MAG: FG-GAP-like repeat-containing protein, partial [Arenicellales bacterium]